MPQQGSTSFRAPAGLPRSQEGKITGQVDITDIIANLGDDSHGLRPAGAARNVEQQDVNLIYRATMGPVDISTCTDLAVVVPIIHDVNGYYRALGIGWPYRPNKRQLREAYQAVDGQSSDYLTYVLKQLLDPGVRSRYDSMPLGKRMRDMYTIQEEARLLSEVAAKVSSESGEVVTIDDLVGDHDRITRQARESYPELPPIFDTWYWGYFLLRCRTTEYEQLAEWLKFLTMAHAGAPVRTISIGLVGQTDEPFLIRQHEGRTIFFLNEQTSASLELAETAVSIVAP